MSHIDLTKNLSLVQIQEGLQYLAHGEPAKQPMPRELQLLTEKEWAAIYQLLLDLEEEKQLSTIH